MKMDDDWGYPQNNGTIHVENSGSPKMSSVVKHKILGLDPQPPVSCQQNLTSRTLKVTMEKMDVTLPVP